MIKPTAYSRLLKYASMLNFGPKSNFNLVSRRPESDSSITQLEIWGGSIQESARNRARRTSLSHIPQACGARLAADCPIKLGAQSISPLDPVGSRWIPHGSRSDPAHELRQALSGSTISIQPRSLDPVGSRRIPLGSRTDPAHK